MMHRWAGEMSPGAGQRSRCPTGPPPAPHAAGAAVTVPGGISCLHSLAAGTAAYIWRIELPHTSECKSPSKPMQRANASLQTPATDKLSRALQGTNSLRKETWLASLLGDNLPCSPGEQSRGSAWHPAALPSCLPPLLPGSAAAQRDQATCPQHPHSTCKARHRPTCQLAPPLESHAATSAMPSGKGQPFFPLLDFN